MRININLPDEDFVDVPKEHETLSGFEPFDESKDPDPCWEPEKWDKYLLHTP